MDVNKQLQTLFDDYNKTNNPLFLFEALLLCLSEDIPLPTGLADWLADKVNLFLDKNFQATSRNKYQNLDECFLVSYGKFEKYRLFIDDKERAGWVNYLKFATGISNEVAIRVLEAAGMNVRGFEGRFPRGHSKASRINKTRQDHPLPEEEKRRFLERLLSNIRSLDTEGAHEGEIKLLEKLIASS